MAKALIKFETIDSDQIRDNMEGRDPRPPAGLDDDSETGRPSGGSTAEDGKVVAGESTIGDPAGQH